jgi:hypothetical protein
VAYNDGITPRELLDPNETSGRIDLKAANRVCPCSERDKGGMRGIWEKAHEGRTGGSDDGLD